MQQFPKDGVMTAGAEIEMISTLGVEDGETTQ
jgi:hypothetical protein